jgi:dephospho-CoA kinase
MLRVGITGGLGSGKSTVGRIFHELGAEVIEADELGRSMMEPGQRVYEDIVEEFGEQVVKPDGQLDRHLLAQLAFQGGRLDDLSAIVHPAVITAQGDWMRKIFSRNHEAIAMVESALIFEVERDARQRGESEGLLSYWRRRFDQVVVVTAPEELKIARYVARVSPSGWDEKVASDARARLAKQISDEIKVSRSDFAIDNSGDLASLRRQVEAVWKQLLELGNISEPDAQSGSDNISDDHEFIE